MTGRTRRSAARGSTLVAAGVAAGVALAVGPVLVTGPGPAAGPSPAADPAPAVAAAGLPAPRPTSPARPAAAPDPGPGAPGPAAGLTQRVECTAPADAASADTGASAAAVRGPDPMAAVHRLADGDGQRIAVIDTGVSRHPRLGERLLGGGDYLAGGDGLDDCDGHGTEVAGLLAAAPDPVTGTGSGIAPRAQVLSLRQSSSRFTVTGPDGRDRPAGEVGTLAAAITRAVALGATVVNISEVVCVPGAQADSVARPLRAAVRDAVRAGVVVVAAAGNVDPSGSCTGAPGLVPMPAMFDDVVAVGAVDGEDRAAGFSVPGPWLDVAAPGVDVASLAVIGGVTGPVLNGTSYAAPVVAGVAALLRERFPSLTPDQIADRLRATARHPAAGRDERVGHGVLDPLAALTAEPLLLRPSDDPAGGAVTGPRTGTGPETTARDRAGARAPLPGLGDRRPDHTVALTAGAAAALLLLGAVSAMLRRLRRAPERTPAPLVRR
ncbi:type VII secretion-associated serine protease mycosin [Pseudonocardia sp. KRD291]|uniref:type VII secretion-associated serine protease mycosin n=1 Tax=Pseudonocardia sp. KRD291 TaxID=2792007 RepID=UPI001C4A5347|nr:type VII secretion-associated serine protease mycosin [Pseudonocardia sp. KRD291]MBW0106888.1 type VII secretion-associated serine protease mycosin [Pseudonocardia sp. KRD291]